jgi:hypothetical protein
MPIHKKEYPMNVSLFLLLLLGNSLRSVYSLWCKTPFLTLIPSDLQWMSYIVKLLNYSPRSLIITISIWIFSDCKRSLLVEFNSFQRNPHNNEHSQQQLRFPIKPALFPLPVPLPPITHELNPTSFFNFV